MNPGGGREDGSLLPVVIADGLQGLVDQTVEELHLQHTHTLYCCGSSHMLVDDIIMNHYVPMKQILGTTFLSRLLGGGIPPAVMRSAGSGPVRPATFICRLPDTEKSFLDMK